MPIPVAPPSSPIVPPSTGGRQAPPAKIEILVSADEGTQAEVDHVDQRIGVRRLNLGSRFVVD